MTLNGTRHSFEATLAGAASGRAYEEGSNQQVTSAAADSIELGDLDRGEVESPSATAARRQYPGLEILSGDGATVIPVASRHEHRGGHNSDDLRRGDLAVTSWLHDGSPDLTDSLHRRHGACARGLKGAQATDRADAFHSV